MGEPLHHPAPNVVLVEGAPSTIRVLPLQQPLESPPSGFHRSGSESEWGHLLQKHQGP